MCDSMAIPETWEDFERLYGFTDKDEVYTNGARLIPSFRVKQWLEHMQTQTADAVQVVYCKDCKHWNDSCLPEDCGWCEKDNHGRLSDFFCKNGERISEWTGLRRE